MTTPLSVGEKRENAIDFHLHSDKNMCIWYCHCKLPSTNLCSVNGTSCSEQLIHQCRVMNSIFDVMLNRIPHMIFVARKENNECYKFKEMLAQPNQCEFLEAMLKETAEH